MISKKKHDALMKKWEKIHAVYQRYSRLETRMPLFLKYIKCLEGKHVLELGCNAGIYGYEIAKIAKSYVGVDQGDCYIKQAKITQVDMDMKNATFLCRPVKGFVRDCMKHPDNAPPINAVFATFVLYHLKDKETDLLAENILPRCDTVLIMTRTSKRSPWKRYNSRKLHKIKNVEIYLKENGFKCKSEMHPTGKFGITLGVKNADNKRDSERITQSESKGAGRSGASSVDKGRLRKGGQLFSAGRQTTTEGPDGILPQVQTAVGGKGDVQGGQRKVLPRQQKSSHERVEKQKEAGTIRDNPEVAKDRESESRPEVQGQADTNVGVGDKD